MPHSGMICGNIVPEYKSCIKQRAGPMGSGWVGLYIKNSFTGQSVTLFRNQLAPGRDSLSRAHKTPDVKAYETYG